MRALHKNAELVLCPYNYVFDENIRAALEIDLTGAAVIIDEGHNVEDVCRDGASMERISADVSTSLMVWSSTSATDTTSMNGTSRT